MGPERSSTPTLLVGMVDNNNRVHHSRQEAMAVSEESSFIQSSVDQVDGDEEEEKFVNG